MEDAIRDIEKLCQEKLVLFQKLLSVFRQERKAIVKADVASLWTFTREKQDMANAIHALREKIFNTAKDAGLINEDDIRGYSLRKIVSAIPSHEKKVLMNISKALNEVKRTLTTLTIENKIFLEESLKTIDDLVHIITRNCVSQERYGRDTYMKPSYSRSAGSMARTGGMI